MAIEPSLAGGTLPRGFSVETRFPWLLRRAGDLVELCYWRALVETRRTPGEVPVYGTNGRCGWHNEALFPGPGVVLGRKGMGPLGVEWCSGPFWVIDTAYSARPRTKDLDLKFLYHLVKYIGLNHLKDGTSNPSLSRDTFYAQLLPLPPLAEQRAIARILGALDDKIELNRQTNETLEAMARALFKSWFVDFDPVRAKMEGRRPEGMDADTAALFPDALESSTLGPVPRGWTVQALDAVVSTTKGVSYRSADLRDDADTALVTLKCVDRGGGYRPIGVKPFVGEFRPEQEVRPGEIVVAQTDLTQAAEVLGRAARARPHPRHQRLVASLDLVIVRPRTAGLETYVYELLRQPRFTEHCYGFANGTTVLHLSARAIPSFQHAMPPGALAARYVTEVSAMHARADALVTECVRLTALRDTLLPKLMSGELRVPEADRAVAAAV